MLFGISPYILQYLWRCHKGFCWCLSCVWEPIVPFIATSETPILFTKFPTTPMWLRSDTNAEKIMMTLRMLMQNGGHRWNSDPSASANGVVIMSGFAKWPQTNVDPTFVQSKKVATSFILPMIVQPFAKCNDQMALTLYFLLGHSEKLCFFFLQAVYRFHNIGKLSNPELKHLQQNCCCGKDIHNMQNKTFATVAMFTTFTTID